MEKVHTPPADQDGEEDVPRFSWRFNIAKISLVLVVTLFLTYVNYFNQDLILSVLPAYYRARITPQAPRVTPFLPFVNVPSGRPPAVSPTPRPTFALSPVQLTSDILFANGPALYVTNGETEHKLTDMPDIILSILPSPDGSKIAVTYKSESQAGGMFDYYDSKLVVFDPLAASWVPVMTAEHTSVTYPRWSSDSRYISFWVGSGDESFVSEATTGNPLFSVKGTAELPVSPIVFSGDGTHVYYIRENRLYEADAIGSGARIISDDARSTRPVHEGPTLPNLPVPSPDGTGVYYYAPSGDFLAYQTESGAVATIAAGTDSGMFGAYPNAFPVGFMRENRLLYYRYGDSGSPGTSMHLFATGDMTGSDPVVTEGLLSKGHADLNGTFVSPDGTAFVVHSAYTGGGLELYDATGSMIQSCSSVDFRYSFYNWGGGTNYAPNLTVWSSDGKFILSESGSGKPLQVMEPRSCTVFTITNTPFTTAVWSPQ